MKQTILICFVRLWLDRRPKSSQLVGKGVSLLLTIQHFAYKTFEKSLIKI